MTAAIYSKRKGLTLELLSDSVGGQVSKTGNIENYPGYERIPGQQLAANIKKHLEDLKVNIRVTRVAKLDVLGDRFRVTTGDGKTYESIAVIVASGSHWKEMNVPGEREYENRGVSFCSTCDGPLFAGMEVAVVGGGNSAAEAVMDLINIASKIYMIVRSTLKADKVTADRIRANSKVTIYEGYTVERVNGSDFVESIDIVSNRGEHKKLIVSGIFVEIGLIPNVAFIKDLVRLNDRGEIIIDDHCRTNVKGLFAAGDVTNVPQKQIIVAAGEGAKAAMDAYTYISTLK